MRTAETEAPAPQTRNPEPAAPERAGGGSAHLPGVAVAAAAAAGGALPRGPAGAAALVRLQKTVGNAQVQRLLAQRAAASAEGGPVSDEVADSIASARGAGSGLGEGVRDEMEEAFGADFARVRVHTDSRADALSRSLGARAFTTGADVFFRAGEFSPSSTGGKRLLAHELTHVVQQGGRSAPVQRALEVGPADDEHEREAERAADAVIAGGAFAGAGAPPPAAGTVRRAPESTISADEIPVPSLVVSLSGFTFLMPRGGRYRRGSRREQLMAAVLRRIVGEQYTPGLEKTILALYGPDVDYTGAMAAAAAPARGGEEMGKVTFSAYRARQLLEFVDGLKLRADVTPEQRELLATAVDADRAWQTMRASPDSALRLPPWYTRTLFERELSQQGDLFARFRRELPAADRGDAAATQKALEGLVPLVERLRASAAVLDALRADPALAADKEAGPVYRSLWRVSSTAAPTTLVSGEEASLFLRYARGRSALASRALDDHDARRTLLEDFGFFRGKLRRGTGDEVLLAAPETPHVAPFPSTLAASPALAAPMYETALGSDRRFTMSIRFATLVEAFTSFRFVWELVPVPLDKAPAAKDAAASAAPPASPSPPPAVAAPPPSADPAALVSSPAPEGGFSAPEPLASFPPAAPAPAPVVPTSGVAAPASSVDVGRAKEAIGKLQSGGAEKAGPGERVSAGDLARMRFERASRYASEDVARMITDLGPVGLGAMDLVSANNMLRYVGAGIRLGVDLLTTNDRGNRSEQVVTFREPGLYLLRCAAHPLQSDDPRAARAPSVAYHPILVRPAQEMAAAATHALVERQAGERALRDEVSALAAAPALPDGVRAILEQMERDLRLADMPLSFALQQRHDDLDAAARALPKESAERGRLEKDVEQLAELLRIQKARGLKSATRLPATFVSDLGHTIPLEMEIETTAREDGWDAEVSDLTTIDSGRETASGADARTAARAAVHAVLSGTQGYGRGWVSFEFHKQLESVRIDASVGQMLTEAVESVTMVMSLAAIAAAPFTGGATLTLLIPIGVVGAAPSAYRLLTRSQAETFRWWDANTASDLLNVVGAAVGVGQAAVASRTAQAVSAGVRPSMALMRVGRGVMLVGMASDVGGVAIMGAQLWEQIAAIRNLPPGEQDAQLMLILGNALVQAGIMGGDVLARRGLEARRAAREAQAIALLEARSRAGAPPHGASPDAPGGPLPARAGGEAGAAPHPTGDGATGTPRTMAEPGPGPGAKAPPAAAAPPARRDANEPLYEALAKEGVRRDLKEPPPTGAPTAGVKRNSTYASRIADWKTAYAAYDQALHDAPGQEVGIFLDLRDGTYTVRVGDEWSVAPPAAGGPWQGLLHYHHNPTAAERYYLPAPADFVEMMLDGDPSLHRREFLEYTIPGVGRGRTEYGIDPSNPKPFYMVAHLPDGSTNTVRFAHDGDFEAYWSSFTVVAPPGSKLNEYLQKTLLDYRRAVDLADAVGPRTMAGATGKPPAPGLPPFTRAETARFEGLLDAMGDVDASWNDLGLRTPEELRAFFAGRSVNDALDELFRRMARLSDVRGAAAAAQRPEANPSRARPPEGLSSREGSDVPEGQRLPRGTDVPSPDRGGFWGGERGDSYWYSDVPAVNRVTGYHPIRFKGGFPDFSPWVLETVYMKITGVDKTDFPEADRILAEQRGFPNKTAYADYRSANRLTWHHLEGAQAMILVPRDLHENVPHVGGASEARAAPAASPAATTPAAVDLPATVPDVSVTPEAAAPDVEPAAPDAPAAPKTMAGGPVGPRRRIVVPSPAAAAPAPASPAAGARKRAPAKTAPAAPGAAAPGAAARGGKKGAASPAASTGALLHPDGQPTLEGIAWLKRNFKRYRGLSNEAVVEKFASEWRGDDLESLVREEMRRAYRGREAPDYFLITAGHGAFTGGEPALSEVVPAIDAALRQAGCAGVSHADLLKLRPDDLIGLLNPNGPHVDPGLRAAAQQLAAHPDPAIRREWERFYTGQGGGGGGETSPFSFGLIGNKRPDAVEVILSDNRLVVTDVTRLYGSPVHNFKTQFYVVLLRRLTGLNVSGVEYRSLFQQTEIP